ncbi:unnamed protein product, partial [Rotaria sp. Silwood1]
TCGESANKHITLVETKEEREKRGHPTGYATPYQAMGGLTGFSSLAEGYLRLDPSGRGTKENNVKGVNQRINKVIQDRIFTSHLNFVKWLPHVFIDFLSSDMMLNRFCSQIFPKIHDKIKWLHLESSSMKYVLCAANYPNLDTLSLNNIDQKSIQCLFN